MEVIYRLLCNDFTAPVHFSSHWLRELQYNECEWVRPVSLWFMKIFDRYYDKLVITCTVCVIGWMSFHFDGLE